METGTENNTTPNKPMFSGRKEVKVMLVIFLIIASLFLLAAIITQVKSWRSAGFAPEQMHTISVSGHGEVYVSPDVALFTFSLTTDGATVKEAQDSVTTKTNAVLAFLKKNNIADNDIKTTDYIITPKYQYTSGVCTAGVVCQPGKQTLVGYTVEQDMQVKIRDTANAGTIIGGMGSLDVQNVSGLEFTIDNPETSQDQARTAAIKDAKQQAQTLASELGVRLGSITDFQESTNGIQPMPLNDMKTMGVADLPQVATPSVPAGQNKVTSDVTVTYEIR